MLGGAGYIGSHVCRHLATSGYRPVTVDNLSTGYLRAVKWGPMEQADIGDAQLLSDIIERHKPAAAIHLAAFIEAAQSVEQPALYYRNNFANTIVALETLLRHGVNKLVFSGSAAVYGEPATIPISVSQPPAPINPYGRSKLAGEYAAEAWAHELPLTIVRPGIVFGPRDHELKPIFRTVICWGVHVVPGYADYGKDFSAIVVMMVGISNSLEVAASSPVLFLSSSIG